MKKQTRKCPLFGVQINAPSTAECYKQFKEIKNPDSISISLFQKAQEKAYMGFGISLHQSGKKPDIVLKNLMKFFQNKIIIKGA